MDDLFARPLASREWMERVEDAAALADVQCMGILLRPLVTDEEEKVEQARRCAQQAAGRGVEW